MPLDKKYIIKPNNNYGRHQPPTEQMNNKTILVTGAAGTVGRELVKQLSLQPTPPTIICTDNNESELFFVEQEYVHNPNVHIVMADLRDAKAMNELCSEVDTVFHTAALKHVILCERNPFEAVQTNILGIQNLIDACKNQNVKRFIFTSSDKAVNPTNVMGTSKLMGERMVTAANSNAHEQETVFASTRFGNVLGSRGSVVPIFAKQIAKGGPITVTDNAMTRFIMTITQAASLVLQSADIAQGGEVFITKMPIVRILDLAQAMIELLSPQYGHQPDDITIKIIGSKPGEKLYEELMSDEETRRAIELQDYFAVTPAFRGIYRDISYQYSPTQVNGVDNPYNSALEKPLSLQEIKDFLQHNNILDDLQPSQHSQRYWPGDK